MAVSKEQIQQIIGEGLTELAQQGVLDLGEISSIVNAISNPLIETFEAQAGLSGLPVRTFTDFNPLSDIVANVKHKVSKPLWTKIGPTTHASTLQNFYTNSNSTVGLTTSQTLPYYINVYDEDPNSAASGGAEPNFALAYGHKTGGGAYNNSNVLSSGDGVTNNGAAVGRIKFAIPFSAANTLYYVCQNHSAMAGTIIIYPSI